MGRYVEFLPTVMPAERVAAPVLFVQCARWAFAETAEGAPENWTAQPWDESQTVVQVEASHFSMLERDAAETARAIEDWITRAVAEAAQQ